MTRKLADAVQRTAQRTVTQGSAAWMLATVTATYTDGTVDISTASGPVARVRRLRSYASPQVGDRIKVSRNPAGNWVVDDATARTADGWQALSLASGLSAGAGATDPPPSARRTVDGQTALSGVISGVSLTTSADEDIATIPAGIRPTYKGTLVIAASTSIVRLTVNPSGSISARLLSGSAPSWVALDGVLCR